MKTPYRVWAPTYFALGWSPIPLPASEKHPIPDHSPITCRCRSNGDDQCQSYTGGVGKYVDMPDMQAWASGKRARAGGWSYVPANVALRLPKGVIGVDVDTYEGKAGAKTLAKAEELWGGLPATWVAANRLLTPASGIRLYGIPDGAWELDWPESLLRVAEIAGGGVELIRWDHRYCMVAPSVHPDGRVYFWRSPSGDVVDLAAVMTNAADAGEDGGEIELPDISELAELPARWIAGLTGGRTRTAGSAGRPGGRGEAAPLLEESAVRAWISERTRTLGELKCAIMERTVVRYLREVRTAGDDGGAHDVARDAAWAVIGDAAAGHAGLEGALIALRSAFMTAVAGRRGDRVADSEWKRIVVRGVSRIAAEGEPDNEDLCLVKAVTTRPRGAGGLASGGSRKAAARSSRAGAFDYTRDDRGNARRLYNALGKGADVRYCPGLGGWLLWDDSRRRWYPDVEGLQIKALWSDIVDEMALEVEDLSDSVTPAARAALAKFVNGCGNVGRVDAVLKMLRTMPGLYVEPSAFDANPELFQAGDSVVVLGRSGATARPAEREDYLLSYTATPYLPGAHEVFPDDGGVNEGAALWWKFLSEAVPDAEVRRWLQIAVGYSLYGGNPQRLLFILEGRTSSGKSTFVEAIRDALGDYGGVFNFSLFRSEREQGPNVALVNLLPKRFVVASEASQNRHLHADEIKRVVGNEALTARLNNSNLMVTRKPAFTPWIATNAAPTINGADLALFKRLVAVRFDEQFEEREDDTLGARLAEISAAAILSWAVEGWNLLCADRKSLRTPPQAAAEATARLRGELNDFLLWLTECAVKAEEDAITPTDELWQSWELWCEMNNVPAGSKVEFGRNLARNGFEKARGREGKSRFPAWRGIALRP